MKLAQIRSLARQHGIKVGHMNKTQLVRAIQKQEGNFDCFATAVDNYCDQEDCIWREDCFTLARRSHDA